MRTKLCHGAGESLPIVQLGIAQCCASVREAVVLARRAILRFLPVRVDQTLTLEASEQGIERALCGRDGLPLAQGEGQLIAIARLVADEQQDTQLDDAASRLGEPVACLAVAVIHCTAGYHQVLCGTR